MLGYHTGKGLAYANS